MLARAHVCVRSCACERACVCMCACVCAHASAPVLSLALLLWAAGFEEARGQGRTSLRTGLAGGPRRMRATAASRKEAEHSKAISLVRDQALRHASTRRAPHDSTRSIKRCALRMHSTSEPAPIPVHSRRPRWRISKTKCCPTHGLAHRRALQVVQHRIPCVRAPRNTASALAEMKSMVGCPPSEQESSYRETSTATHAPRGARPIGDFLLCRRCSRLCLRVYACACVCTCTRLTG